jgi:homocysteine S-methyltransferase
MLHNGAEYHGNYDCTHAELVEFHAGRIQVLGGVRGREAPDLLAFETLPSLAEAQAIGEALNPWPDLAAWFTFTCKDEEHVAHGESLSECATYVAGLPQTIAIGVNCTRPSFIPRLIGQLRGASSKPVVVYPNSGEAWDAERRCWIGSGDPETYGAKAADWFVAGAQIVGGCCRTRPTHIRLVAETARSAAR